MRNIISMAILLMAYVSVFMEARVEFFRDVFGAQISLLPALMICASLMRGIWVTTLLAILGGLWVDSLSNNPLGVSVLPLFLVGFGVCHFRDLLLRQNVFAQFVLGLAASVIIPLLTLFFILNVGGSPLMGWKSIWQFIVMAAGGGVATPLLFRILDWLDDALNYKPASQMTFRPDREIKHGRGGQR